MESGDYEVEVAARLSKPGVLRPASTHLSRLEQCKRCARSKRETAQEARDEMYEEHDRDFERQKKSAIGEEYKRR